MNEEITKLELIKHPNDILNKVSDDFNIGEYTEFLFKDMVRIMESNGGVGLAAPQIGINKRFFIMKLIGKIELVINPRILNHGKEALYKEEGCLSVPDIKKELKRWNVIDVKYITMVDGSLNYIETTFKKQQARIFQHEYDHLDGILCMFKKEE